MEISITICTRKRPDSLERTLYSIVQSANTCNRADFEVLVVDNGGTLDILSMQENFCKHIPLRVIREDRLGLSIARNTGVSNARGNWIVWTDDDVTVDPAWLPSYFSAIRRFPDSCVMGGPIIPSLDGRAPDWLIRELHHVRTAFASRYPEDVKELFQKGDSIPWGANFAILREAALRFPFDPRLGRHPNWPTRGGEESAVIHEILSAGGSGRWLRNAKVIHHIDPSRQTRKYLRSYYFDLGYRNTMQQEHVPGRRIVFKNLCSALYRAAGNEARCMVSRVAPGNPNLVLHLKQAAKNWGKARALITLARTRGLPLQGSSDKQ